MSYDIYGNNLRSGHCEVHPHVHEPYPCSVCYQEGNKYSASKQQEREREREYYKAMQEHYEEEWMKDNSIVYRFLLKIGTLLNKLIEIKRKSLSERCPI